MKGHITALQQLFFKPTARADKVHRPLSKQQLINNWQCRHDMSSAAPAHNSDNAGIAPLTRVLDSHLNTPTLA
jgi:hypothetical protein